jgi:hypothetical protein
MHKRLLTVSLALYLLQSTGCGVLLYPERQGQKSGRIDPAIAILDGIGLLLFLIPGLVAFAVDFHQGTIYLPGGHSGNIHEPPGPRAVKVEGPMTEENIERVLRAELGQDVDLTGLNVQALRINADQLRGLPLLALQEAQRKTL